MQRFDPAKPTPTLEDGPVIEKPQEDFLVIAPQGVNWRRKIVAAQPVEDAGGGRSPIDIVPEENRHDLGRRGNKVGADLFGQGVQEVETAVDVADRIDTHSRRK